MILPYLNVTQKGMILTFVPVVFQLLFLALLGFAFVEAERKLEDLEHSRRALSVLQNMSHDMGRAAMTIGNTQLPAAEQLSEIDTLSRKFKENDKWLGLSKTEFPELKDLVTEIEEAQDSALWVVDKARAVISDPAIKPRKRIFFIGRIPLFMTVRKLQVVTRHIEELETRHQREDPATLKRIWISLLATIACGFVGNVALSMILVARLTNDMRSRLGRVGENAQRLGSADKAKATLLPMQEGTDEIASLDRSLHESAAILEELRRREFSMLDNAADVIFSLDTNLCFTACNNAAKREWGFADAELIGTSLLDRVDPQNKATLRLALENAIGISNDVRTSSIETTIVGKTGKLQSYVLNINWSEQWQLLFCAAQNITQLKSIQQFRRNFVSMVSHDLRSPLLAVGISPTLLQAGKRGPVSAKTMQDLQRAEGQLDHLKDLINGLLLWDKIQSGAADTRIEQAKSDDLCNDVVEDVKAAARQGGVKIRQLVVPATFQTRGAAVSDILTLLLKDLIRRCGRNKVITLYCDDGGDVVNFKGVCEAAKGKAAAALSAAEPSGTPSEPTEHSEDIVDRVEPSSMLQKMEASIISVLLERQRGRLDASQDGANDRLNSEFSFSIPKEISSDV